MRILIVGSDKVYAIENLYAKYLRELGIEVERFNSQSMFYNYYQKDIINKIIFRAGASSILKEINLLFKKIVQNFNPEIVWVFKGMEMFPSTLEWVNNLGIKLVNYNPDNPFIFSGNGSGNKYITDSIHLYHLHFTYNMQIQDELQKKFNIKTSYLPFGFDISDELYQECVSQDEIIKTCFLGNPDKQRAAFINTLAESGIQLDLYGNNWNRFVNHPNVSIYLPVYGDELWKNLRKYRVQLNLMRPHNEDSHNMRSFEVPGVGGIMLAPDTTEHKMFFENEIEIFLYKTVYDCVDKINYLSNLNNIDSERIRENARNRSLISGYSYKNRAVSAFNEFKILNG